MNIAWKEALQRRNFVYGLVLAVVSLLVLAFFMPYFFREVIAGKPGIVLNDFILDYLTPTDWSWTIFILIYSTMLLTVATNYKNPSVMLLGLSTYSLVTWLRMLTIYLFTLEAPKGLIVLQDPFLSLVVYSSDYFVKDLFFSGHISSMTVFVLVEPNKSLRWIKAATTVVVAVLILDQHVHYALDVVVAPLFTFVVYRLVMAVQKASDRLR